MIKNFLLLVAASCFLVATGCGKDKGASGNGSSASGPQISMSLRTATDAALTIDVELENADVAYCMIADAQSATPSLSEIRKGECLTGSQDVVFGELKAGTTYRIFGVAAKDGIYTDVKSLEAQTSGERDENYPSQISAWQTTADKKLLFSPTAPAKASTATAAAKTITIDSQTKYQTMEGFGPAITGSAAYNLLKMSAADRDRILRAAFDPEEGMGYNYVRVSIGCSDFSLDEYTCCDQKGIEFFEMHEYDKRDLFPVLREILAINPDVKIIAAPWTAPLWMKSPENGTGSYDKWTGGRVNPDHYGDYAEYFVLWIQEMEANGFPIESVTPQNEPLNSGNSASTHMTWEQQRAFVRDHLGPAFRENGITTKIWAYDHNFDVPDYVLNIYADKEAAQYFEGSAWHAYGGSYTVLARIHQAAPEKSIYFTEQSIGTWCPNFGDNLMWHMAEVGLGTINNYCRAVVLWNFMLDANRGPNRPGGCTTCYGFVDCDGTYSYASLTYRSHWYAIGHLSKVIRRGACRVRSSVTAPDVTCTAFENPDGTHALVLLNQNASVQQFVVRSETGDFTFDAPARSVTSVIW